METLRIFIALFVVFIALFVVLITCHCHADDVDNLFQKMSSASFEERCAGTREMAKFIFENKDEKVLKQIIKRAKEEENLEIKKRTEFCIRRFYGQFDKDLKENIYLWHIPNQYRYEGNRDICAECYEEAFNFWKETLNPDEIKLKNVRRVLDVAEELYCRRWFESYRDINLLREIAKQSKRNCEKEFLIYSRHSIPFQVYHHCDVFEIPESFENRIKKSEILLKEVNDLYVKLKQKYSTEEWRHRNELYGEYEKYPAKFIVLPNDIAPGYMCYTFPEKNKTLLNIEVSDFPGKADFYTEPYDLPIFP